MDEQEREANVFRSCGKEHVTSDQIGEQRNMTKEMRNTDCGQLDQYWSWIRKTAMLSSSAVICLSMSSPLYGAVTTVSGGVSTGYEYFDRQYDHSNSSSNNDDYSRFRISPFVTVVSETTRQSLNFHYAPSYWYDFDQSDDKWDHLLSLEYLRLLTRYWNISVADNLRVTDEFNTYSTTVDPATGDIISEGPGADVSGDTLRDETGRRRYTLNSLNLGTAYTYYEDSSVALDGAWTALRNNDVSSGSNYQDYDKYNVGLTVAHRYDIRWKSTVNAGVVLGRYDSVAGSTSSDNSDDVNEYRASLLVDYRLSQLHTLSGYYRYDKSDYDSSESNDVAIHTATFGWSWEASPRLSLNVGAGPTYTKRDNSSGDWNPNADFGLRYRLEKSSFGVKASHGTRLENFSGTDQRGSSKYWRLQTDLQHAISERVSLSAYANYSKEDRDESSVLTPTITDTTTTDVYAAGCNLSYRFWENYTASLVYGYVHSTSDNDEDNYDDNRVVMTISYANDFFQW